MTATVGVSQAGRRKTPWLTAALLAALWTCGFAAVAVPAAMVVVLVWHAVGHFVETLASVSENVLGALAMSLLLVAAALPFVIGVSLLAAIVASDASMRGPSAWIARMGARLFSDLPPVVVGVAVLFAATTAGLRLGFGTGFVALVLLNIPAATGALTQVLSSVPDALRVAGAAAGASPLRVAASIIVPGARAGLIETALNTAAGMLGETAALAVALGRPDGLPVPPLAVQIWQAGGVLDPAPAVAAEGVALMLPILALLAAARALGRSKAKGTAGS